MEWIMWKWWKKCARLILNCKNKGRWCEMVSECMKWAGMEEQKRVWLFNVVFVPYYVFCFQCSYTVVFLSLCFCRKVKEDIFLCLYTNFVPNLQIFNSCTWKESMLMRTIEALAATHHRSTPRGPPGAHPQQQQQWQHNISQKIFLAMKNTRGWRKSLNH